MNSVQWAVKAVGRGSVILQHSMKTRYFTKRDITHSDITHSDITQSGFTHSDDVHTDYSQ